MKVYLTSDAWLKMRAYVDLSEGEISGLGRVEKREGALYVTDVRIFTQTVSGAHSDIETQALAQFQCELHKEGDTAQAWSLWWHSHANMGVFFSARDVATINESTDFRYLLSIVTNHAHEFKARIDVYEPVRMFVDAEVEILLAESEKITKLCQKEIEKKVTVPVQKVGYQSTTQTLGKWEREYEDDYSASHYYPQKKTTWEDVDTERIVQGYNVYLEEKEELEEELASARKSRDKVSVQLLEEEIRALEQSAQALGYR